MGTKSRSGTSSRRRSTHAPNAWLGCRVKSGWASAVLIDETAAKPKVLDQCRIELSDPRVPETVQPYHAAFGTEQSDARVVRRLTTIVHRCAKRSVADLLARYHEAGHRVGSVAVVVGSVIDPATIANQHIRAHASEGRLFRTALVDAFAAHGVSSTVFVERDLRETLARRRRQLTELGRGLDGPWRVDEKMAALAAMRSSR